MARRGRARRGASAPRRSRLYLGTATALLKVRRGVIRMQRAVVVIACLGVLCSGAAAEAFRIEDVRSIAGLTAGQLKPHTIYFADQRKDELADPVTGLVRFEDWARARPRQKQF